MNLLTRQEAITAGLTRYFTGRECPRGHVAERLVSTRACAACAREKKHAWSAANPDKVNAQKRAYRSNNLDKVKGWQSAEQKRNREAANVRNRRYAETHREQLKAKNKVWEAANPGKVLAKAAKRRAAELRAMPKWADKEKIEKVYALAARFRSLGCDFHVDHVIPLQGRNVCGLHVHNNLEIIEARQNRSKSNQLHH